MPIGNKWRILDLECEREGRSGEAEEQRSLSSIIRFQGRNMGPVLLNTFFSFQKKLEIWIYIYMKAFQGILKIIENILGQDQQTRSVGLI